MQMVNVIAGWCFFFILSSSFFCCCFLFLFSGISCWLLFLYCCLVVVCLFVEPNKTLSLDTNDKLIDCSILVAGKKQAFNQASTKYHVVLGRFCLFQHCNCTQRVKSNRFHIKFFTQLQHFSLLNVAFNG